MRRITKLLLALTLILSMSLTAFASESDFYILSDTPYEYTVKPGTESWKALSSDERVTLCNVPVSVARELTTEALMKTVLNNPFVACIYAYDTIDEGIQVFCGSFPFVETFIQRNDSLSVLQDYISACEINMQEDGGSASLEYYVATRLYQYILKSCVSAPDVFIDPVTGFSAIYVQTPNGTNVMVYLYLTYADHNTTSSEVEAATNRFMKLFDLTMIRTASPTYNCHAYAWYSTSATGYWMDNPSAYMTDGSYSSSTTAAVGRKVTYKNGSVLMHSGIVTAVSGTNVTVVSKWGCMGLFSHSLTDNIYYSSGATAITYWY